jgi:hypothetical protein
LEEDRSEIEEFLVRAIATKVEAADDSADGARTTAQSKKSRRIARIISRAKTPEPSRVALS